MKTKHTIEIEVEWPVSETAIYAGVTVVGNAEPLGEDVLWSLEGLKRNFGIERPFTPTPTQVTWIDRADHEVPTCQHVLVCDASAGVSADPWIAYYITPLASGATHWAPLPELPQVRS